MDLCIRRYSLGYSSDLFTDKFGEKKEVTDSFNGGIYSEFKGFITIEIPTENTPLDISYGFFVNSTIFIFF